MPITSDDRTLFTDGDCPMLALEIHARTGWPVCALTDDDGNPDFHVFVLCPDGEQGIDVDGTRPIEEIIGDYDHAASWCIVETHDLLAEWGCPMFADSAARIGPVADEVLLEWLSVAVG